MNPTPTDYLLILVAALLAAVLYGFNRIVNSAGSVTWQVKTTPPEPSTEQVARLQRERDQAREQAERVREELGARQ